MPDIQVKPKVEETPEVCDVCGKNPPYQFYGRTMYCLQCWDNYADGHDDRVADAAIDDESDREYKKGGEQD